MNTPVFRRGFTLVELLVVLTIIGLLAGLLFPAFLKARENANKTVCESNLHQIGLAIQMYQADNSGAPPPQFGDVRGIAADEQPELDPLLPYEHAPAIYHCPDAGYHVDGKFGPFGAVYLDYNYRVADLLNSNTGLFPSGIPSALMKPEPLSVLAYDMHHGEGQSLVCLVLRENGAVSRVPQAETILWQYAGGKWQPWSDKSTSRSQPWTVFPEEPWPPQFDS